MNTTFEAFIKETGVTDKKFYDTLNISLMTWKKRVQNPKDFTVEQLVLIAKILRLSTAELIDLIMNSPTI